MLCAMKKAIWGSLLVAIGVGVAGCAGSPAARSLCEGLQMRVRVVDPLADPKTSPNPASCEQYEAERSRLTAPDAR
jgi:nucleoside-diphosphate-sugar epimerase